MAETTKTDLICDTLGVVPLRRQTSNMLWHANVSWTFSRNVWGNQHFFFFFAILYTHNKHSQDSRPDLLHSNKSYTIERPGGRVGIWGYPYITSTHSLHSLQQPSSGVVFFSCLEVCESTHQHSCLSKLLSPHHCSVTPVRGEAGGAHSHTNTCGGFSGGGGGGWWRCWPDVNDLTRYRIRLRLYRSNPPACVSLNRLVSSGQVEGQTGRLKTLWEK